MAKNCGIVPGDIVKTKCDGVGHRLNVTLYKNRDETMWFDYENHTDIVKYTDIAFVMGSFRRRERRNQRLKTKLLLMTSRGNYGWAKGDNFKCINRET